MDPLQQAVIRQQQASGQLAGLEEQKLRAEALRDRIQEPVANSGGISSVLGAFSQVLDANKGRDQLRELAPQLEKARASVAAGEAAQLNEGIRLKKAIDRRANSADRRQERRALQIENSNQGKAETWYDPDVEGSRREVVYDNLNRPMFTDGTPVPENYIQYSPMSGAFRGTALKDNTKLKFTEKANILRETGDTISRWDASYAKPVGLPTQALNSIASAMSKNDILKYVAPDMDPQVKKSMQWWADWRYFITLPQRNEKFGATLSVHEKKAWDDAELVSPGMDPSEIQGRINRLYTAMESRMRRDAGTWRAGDAVEANHQFFDSLMGELGYGYGEDGYSFGEASSNVNSWTDEDDASLDAMEAERKAAMGGA